MLRSVRREVLIGGVLAALLVASPASGAVFTVDTQKDGIDANLADALCAAANGKCTLRAAIDEANDTAGDDDIELPEGTFRLTIPKGEPESNAEGDLHVTEAVQITGEGARKTVIEQTKKDRVLVNFAPFAGFSMPGLRVSGLTISGGDVRGAGENGGAGLENEAFALLDNIVVRDNVARSDAFDDVPAGGIYSNGVLGLSESVVRDNAATGRGDASPAAGGIQIHNGSATIQDGSRIVGNIARVRDPLGVPSFGRGGGLVVNNPGSNAEDTVTITDSTIAGNTALGGGSQGAGIAASPGTFIELNRSAVAGNRARRGGGIYATSANITILNSTFSGNVDTRDGGAAIWQQGGPGQIELTHATLAENDPSRGSFAIEAGEQAAVGSLELHASIVANPGTECGPEEEEGAVAAEARNVIQDDSCSIPPVTSDHIAPPRLKPLADNGGPTMTHALKGGSPAISFVNPCSVAIDQRSKPRALGGLCDAGAFERP